MKRQFINDLYASFALWADHTLSTNGRAFQNVSSSLYSIVDDKFAGLSVYGSPYKQWIYNSSISGAQIPSGVYSNGTFIPRGQSGLKIDFNNGRVMFNGGVNIPVSGQFSAKEFGVYTTTQADQELIFEQRVNFASQFPQVGKAIESRDIIAPAIFIRFGTMSSEPFAFGGEYNSKIDVRIIILSDSNYKLDAVGNIFVDQKEKNFLVVPQTPLNEFGDLKTGYYGYFDYLNQYNDSRKLAYIEEVDFSKLVASNTKNPDLQAGFLDLKVSLPRFL